jgi:hypothetical protein
MIISLFKLKINWEIGYYLVPKKENVKVAITKESCKFNANANKFLIAIKNANKEIKDIIKIVVLTNNRRMKLNRSKCSSRLEV